MIGYYPYVIGALLLVHLHSTTQFRLFWRTDEIREQLRKEKPGILGSASLYEDVACEKLTAAEKQELCDEAMLEAVAYEKYMTAPAGQLWNDNSRTIRVVEYLRKKSTFPVPRLANENNPYRCKKIPIEGMGLEKLMFWCRSRVFTFRSGWQNYKSDSDSSKSDSSVPDSDSYDSDETNPFKGIAQKEGFFLASGRTRNTIDTAFLFKPSPTNDREVVPWANIEGVEILFTRSSRYY